MKIPPFRLALGAAIFCAGLRLVAPAAEVPSPAIPEADHYVYLSELPDPDELSKDATANGMTVTRIDRTADRLVISYRYADGSAGTVGYALLSARKNDRVAARPVTVENRPVTVVERRTVVTPEPEVIYVDRGYRSRVVYSDPWDFWGPVTLGVGLGWATTWHGGHYYHHHHGHHGRWHR